MDRLVKPDAQWTRSGRPERQRGPLGPEPAIVPCQTASGHEICPFHHARDTLRHLNLHHMDFLDDLDAIHGSRLTISDATQDESPNEYKYPEIWTIQDLFPTHSFCLILLAITPD